MITNISTCTVGGSGGRMPAESKQVWKGRMQELLLQVKKKKTCLIMLSVRFEHMASWLRAPLWILVPHPKPLGHCEQCTEFVLIFFFLLLNLLTNQI